MNSKKIMRGVALFMILVFGTNIMLGQLNTQAIVLPPDDLPRTVTYKGNVRDSDGNGLPGATVRLYSGSSLKKTVTAGTNGYYSITVIQYSSPILKASKTDYITQSKSVSINGGSYYFYLEQDIPVFPTYTGVVKDTSGNFIGGALVELFSSGSRVSTDITISTGEYCVGNDVVNSGYIKVSKENYIDESISVSSTGGTYNFVLESIPEPYPVFTGCITDFATNEAIEDAFVELISDGSIVNSMYVLQDGSYNFDEDYVNTAQIRASANGYYSYTESVLSHGDEKDFSLVQMPSSIHHTVSGFVHDDAGLPIEDAEIVAFDNNGIFVGYEYSNGDGSYELSIPESNMLHIISVTHEHYLGEAEYFNSEYEIFPNRDYVNFDLTLFEKTESDIIIGDDFDYKDLADCGWRIDKFGDSTFVGVVDTIGQGLEKFDPYGRVVKLSKYSNEGLAIIRKDFAEWEHPIPETNDQTLLISSQIAYGCDAQEITCGNFGYMAIEFNRITSPFLIKFFDYDTTLHQPNKYGEPLYNPLENKRTYQIDVLFDKDLTDMEIDFSVYINGECIKYGSFADSEESISVVRLEFGLSADEYSELYVDNVYIDYPMIYNFENNLDYFLANPLTWHLAPDFEGVTSDFVFKYEEGAKVTLSFFLGQTFENFFLSSGIGGLPEIDLDDWELNGDKRYTVGLSWLDEDVIIHIRHQLTFDKMEIWIDPEGIINPAVKRLNAITDIEYLNTRFSHLTASQFSNDYNWVPENPRESGFNELGIIDESYYQDIKETVGEIGVHSDSDSCSNTLYLGLSIDLGLRIGASLKFTAETSVETELKTRLSLRPNFRYGLPNEHSAYMGVQPCIAIWLGTNSPIPDSNQTDPIQVSIITKPDPVFVE